MAATSKKDEPKTQMVTMEEAQLYNKNTRIAYYTPFEKQFGISKDMWAVLCDSIFPSATNAQAIVLAIRYCQANKLDIMKKPVHIVPMYSSALKKTVDTVWPSINFYRTIASRTGVYAGCDETRFGPTIKRKYEATKTEWENGQKSTTKIEFELSFPEWAATTVYKVIGGQRCAFHGPKVYFEETFSTSGKSQAPNDRWQRAPFQMLEKCAEAAALRRAFPEEIGNDPTAEEMEGKVFEGQAQDLGAKISDKDVEVAGDKPMDQQADGVQDAEFTEASDEAPITDDTRDTFDTLKIGVENCKSLDELSDYLTENEEVIQHMLKNGGKKIADMWQDLNNRKMQALSGKLAV